MWAERKICECTYGNLGALKDLKCSRWFNYSLNYALRLRIAGLASGLERTEGKALRHVRGVTVVSGGGVW